MNVIRFRAHLTRRTAVLCTTATLAPLLIVAALAFACAPGGDIHLSSESAVAGSKITVNGHNFPEIPMTITGPNAVVLGTTSGPTFAKEVTVPDVAPGWYVITAKGQQGDLVVQADAPLEVIVAPTPPPPPPPPPPAVVPPPPPAPEQAVQVLPSPELVPSQAAGPQLLRPVVRNETISVSRTGAFTLNCGRFEAGGVSGTCRASSTSGRPALALAARAFRAVPGRAIRVRYQLTRPQLRRLAAARRLPMRATVKARDALGNQSTRTFAFALKAAAKRS